MQKKEICPRMNPEESICPIYDSTGNILFYKPGQNKMGVQVLDNFPEEHIQ